MRRIIPALVAASLFASALYAQEAPEGRGPSVPQAGPDNTVEIGGVRMNVTRAPGVAATAPAPVLTPVNEKVSVTLATLRLADNSEIGYTASAGYMPLKDEQGKLRANIFYTAYVVQEHPEMGPATTSAPASQPAAQGASPAATTGTATAPARAGTMPSTPGRPVMFVFNGGPGAASVWLHLGAAGPKRLDIPEDGTAPAAPYRLVDNPYSWLGSADLVFIDPVNTGFSRAAEPGQAKEFFGVREDVDAVAEFVRLWLTKNNRWNSPVFVAGESYGTTRAAVLAGRLQERTGVQVAGVILMSSVLNFGMLDPTDANDEPYALYLPSYAAVAWYHHKTADKWRNDLEGLIKESERFAINDYTVALAKGAALSAEDKRATAAAISGLTGLSADYILRSDLRIKPERFEQELLHGADGEGGQVIGRFDGRITAPAVDAIATSQEFDPSLAGFYPAYGSAFNSYVRRVLRFDSDLPYEVLSGRTQPWDWGGNGTTGYLYVGDNLRDAMVHNPHLRLMVCQGYFDLATPFFATDYTLNHLHMPAEIRKNIVQKYFAAGHMMYHTKEGVQQLSQDVHDFVSRP